MDVSGNIGVILNQKSSEIFSVSPDTSVYDAIVMLNEKNIAGFTREAMSALSAAPWLGNVRELENTIERAVALCSGHWIDAPDLSLEPGPHPPYYVQSMLPFPCLKRHMSRPVKYP